MKDSGTKKSIQYPVDAKNLIPQKDPMRFVDKILDAKEKETFISYTVPVDSPFVDSDGYLDEVTFMEIIAQSAAANAGLTESVEPNEPLKGFLLGCSNFVIEGAAKAGDELVIKISKQAAFGEFSIIDGYITRDGVLIASGEIKIWREEQD